MTTFLEDAKAVLDPLAAGGAWYGVNTAQPPVLPYITWLRLVSSTNNTFDGASNLQNTRIQVDIHSRTAEEADAIGRALVTAMQSAPFKNVQLSSQDMYEDAVKLYRISMDFSCWSYN